MQQASLESFKPAGDDDSGALAYENKDSRYMSDRRSAG